MMESPALFNLVLMILTLTSAVGALTISASQNPVLVNSDVTFSSSATISLGAWTFGTTAVVIFYPGDHVISQQWRNRAEYSSTTSALTLKSVQLTDAGTYRLQHLGGNSIIAELHFSVQEHISAVMVNDSGAMAIAPRSFTLTCEVNGSFDQIDWWKHGNMVTADNTTILGMSNKTLTLNPVQMSDGGDYQCRASNSVGDQQITSDPYRLIVYFGPMTPVIMGPMVGLIGSSMRLNCSSDSLPASQQAWYFNSSMVSTGSVYHVGPLTYNMSGDYTCVASNNITGRNSFSTRTFTVIDPVSMVSVVGSEPYAVHNRIFTLTCHTRGTVNSITWMYQGMQLQPCSNKNLSMDNAALTFDRVMRSDNGNYSCEASNPRSSLTSDNFTLTVAYGPENTTIMGPRFGKVGGNVTLTCTASSHPSSQYQWFYNNSLMANTSEYMVYNLTTSMSGNYTCVADNNITGLNSSTHMTLTVLEPIGDVRVVPPTSLAVEDGSHQLSCEAIGSVYKVTWMKNGKPLISDNRTVVDMRNYTVTFDPVHRNDSGYYQCVAMNPCEDKPSTKYELAVIYGPDAPVIYGPSYGEVGQSAVFNCTASSVPPSEFSWWFNGTHIANTSTLTIGGLFLNMSGNYTCRASNNVTGRNSTSSQTLTVVEIIQSVLVKNNSIPISGENLTLSCEVVGPYHDVHWMKDNKVLGMNDSNPQVSNDTALHFRPLELRHDGEYQCVAANKVRPYTSAPYELLANYGPVNVCISGPELAEEGDVVTMKCSADSRPNADFKWFLPFQASSVLNKPNLTFTATGLSEGRFTCLAWNPVTNRTMTGSKIFTVQLNGVASASQNLLIQTGLMTLYLAWMLP